jgi:DNA-binding SARP family transcriptional activator
MPRAPVPTPAPADARWRLRLLGAPALLAPDGREHTLGAGDAALLAFLALQGAADRHRLAALLWPDAAPAAALNSLRQRVFKLQRLSGSALLEAGRTLAIAAGVMHDLADPGAALAADPRAVAGPLLGEHVYEPGLAIGAWVAAQRLQWHDRLRDELTRLAAQREAAGRIAEALAYATRLVAEQPLHEHGVRLLMRLHQRRGDRGAALEVFERCVQALHRELGEAPGDETVALAQAIARGSGAPASAPMRPLPPGLRHPPLTVGRAALLSVADQRWQAGDVVLLLGPAGIGKTRLLEELVPRWQIEIAVSLQPDDAGTALALVRRLASALMRVRPDAVLPPPLRWLVRPDGLAPPAGELDAERLAEWVQQALEAAEVRALAVDNLHWADEESAAMLSRLLPDGTRPSRTRWLLAARADALPPSLAGWHARADAALAPSIDVTPMSVQAVQALLVSLELPRLQPVRWAAPLHAHCGGHPLHLLQVLRTLHEREQLDQPMPPPDMPVPETALRGVRRWLDASPPAAQQLAFVVALAGPDFDPDLAAEVMGCTPAALSVPWRCLHELGLLREQAFSHELIAQAVREALPPALAPGLRRDIAAAMAVRGLAPARRAAHWEAAGRWAEAAADHALAAQQLLQAGLQVRAVSALRAATAAHERAGQPSAAFETRWREAGLVLRSDSAREALAAAQGLVAMARGDAQGALAWSLLAQVQAELQDAAGVDAAARAVAHARRTGDALLLARAQLREGGALMAAGRTEAALTALRAVQAQRVSWLPEERLDVEDALAVTLSRLGRRREALAASEAGLHRALAERDHAGAATHAGNCAIQLAYLLRMPEALEAARQAIAFGRETGAKRGYLLLDEMGLAGLYQDLGRLGAALELLVRVTEGLQAAGYAAWALNAENALGALYLLLGRSDLAQRRLGEPPADAPAWSRAARWATRARLEREQGRPARPWLERALAALESHHTPIDAFVLHRIQVERSRGCPPAQAIDLTTAARAWAREHEHPALERVASVAEVDAWLRAGNADAAARAAEGIERAADPHWHTYNAYLPEHWWVLARAWQAAGAPERARRRVLQAQAWIAARAAEDVPAEFRAGFRDANLVHRALAAMAADLGCADVHPH